MAEYWEETGSTVSEDSDFIGLSALEAMQITALRDGQMELLSTMPKSSMTTALKRRWDKIMDKVLQLRQRTMMSEAQKAVADEQDKILDILEDKAEAVKHSEQPSHYLITVNPKPDTKLEDFVSKLNKCTSKRWFSEFHLTIEQRSEEGTGEGIHSHMLISNPFKPVSAMRTEIFNTFRSMVGNPLHIDIRPIKPAHFTRTLSYVLGEKVEESKMSKVRGDDIWRETVGLRKFYKNEKISLDT